MRKLGIAAVVAGLVAALSAAGAAAAPRQHALPWKGSASGQVETTHLGAFIVGSGTMTASHLGKGTIDVTTSPPVEDVVLTAANGDQVFATVDVDDFSSTFFTGAPGPFVLTVVGGTGHFSHAAGSAVGETTWTYPEGPKYDLTSSFTMTWSGTITP